MARVTIKSKRVQFLVLLLFLAILLPALLSQVRDIYLAFRLNSSGQTVKGRVNSTWTNRHKGARSYYVEYEFDLGNVTYSARHRATKAVMLQAGETRVVQVYYLPNNPAANAPLFWGDSVFGYVVRVSWMMLLMAGLCSLLALQVWAEVREDKDVLRVWKYTFPEAMFGLVVILFAGIGIRGLFSWSSLRIGDFVPVGLPMGKVLAPFLVLGFLFVVFGMVLMQEKD